ncbi:Oidioi.mRNA.OKI2018_I69.PAR.g10300.t1.cds [Oikopleura dioica]|uniref:Oidioi.mRNA.OKI2018_I69.PAR.g10300.t1.cds n=1 Tax=Oikopleura dioica TaxID=34765 RepID=A0ABN7RT32_OIKDI|nr:Oidioi.mRNA.OKI2018_I69.PAR.g10300.t1.cds [Oikopleura dioica]
MLYEALFSILIVTVLTGLLSIGRRSSRYFPKTSLSDGHFYNSYYAGIREEVIKQTGFSPKDVDYLFRRFGSLDRCHKRYLDTMDFHGINGLCHNVLGEQVIEMFLHTDTGHCDFMRFCKVIATFRKSRNPEEKKELIKKKIALIYEMFDVNSDGQITRDDIVILLRHMMGNKVCISTIKSIAQRMIYEGNTRKGNKDTSDFTSMNIEQFTSLLDKEYVYTHMSIK